MGTLFSVVHAPVRADSALIWRKLFNVPKIDLKSTSTP